MYDNMNGSGSPGLDPNFGAKPQRSGWHRFALFSLALVVIFMIFISLRSYIQLNAKPADVSAAEASSEIERQGAAEAMPSVKPTKNETKAKPSEGPTLSGLWAYITGTSEAEPTPSPKPPIGNKEKKAK